MDTPGMSQESLGELSANLKRLTALIPGIEYYIQADTGKLAIYKDGEWYKLNSSMARRADLFPETHGEIMELINSVEEAMAHYIGMYGVLPPEVCVQ